MGGGNKGHSAIRREQGGLSPRGRGKPITYISLSGLGGSIPAWAGETAFLPSSALAYRVYPRVGGGNKAAAASLTAALGLSPRGRGKRIIGGGVLAGVWSIPAWAGETIQTLHNLPLQGVYPRVGGGNPSFAALSIGSKGLSPRGRGKLRSKAGSHQEPGSIPAWAGETAMPSVN